MALAGRRGVYFKKKMDLSQVDPEVAKSFLALPSIQVIKEYKANS